MVPGWLPCAQGHHPCQKPIQNALRGRIWIMRGHPAITVKLFLTWTAGVLAYGLVCAGPPDTMMATRRDCALVFDTDGGGRHVSRCVLSRARAHLAHAARAPNIRHHDGHPVAIAHWFSTKMVGADMVPDVCCHVRGGTWHTLRVPRTWRTWRGWSTRHTWRTWRTWPSWRTRRARHAWAPGAPGPPGARGAPRPSVAHMGSVLVPSSCPSKDGR